METALYYFSLKSFIGQQYLKSIFVYVQRWTYETDLLKHNWSFFIGDAAVSTYFVPYYTVLN